MTNRLIIAVLLSILMLNSKAFAIYPVVQRVNGQWGVINYGAFDKIGLNQRFVVLRRLRNKVVPITEVKIREVYQDSAKFKSDFYGARIKRGDKLKRHYYSPERKVSIDYYLDIAEISLKMNNLKKAFKNLVIASLIRKVKKEGKIRLIFLCALYLQKIGLVEDAYILLKRAISYLKGIRISNNKKARLLLTCACLALSLEKDNSAMRYMDKIFSLSGLEDSLKVVVYTLKGSFLLYKGYKLFGIANLNKAYSLDKDFFLKSQEYLKSFKRASVLLRLAQKEWKK